MYRKQQGFTLVEIAIVLVIIGLLLGGVLKGQELINSAKVKNLAQDFRNIPLFIYGYQDKYKAIPGDDRNVGDHIGGVCANTTPGDPTTSPCYATAGTPGNGVINGAWNSTTTGDESFRFWQHVRLAGFAAGPTTVTDTAYTPRNADGGIMGIQSNVGFTTITLPTAMTGTYIVCSDGILGKFAKQLDSTIDDGETSTGSLRAVLQTAPGTAVTSANIADANSYTVCMGI
jgi:prepilin-type N-terminal cleavage/methylation domain-containing protein